MRRVVWVALTMLALPAWAGEQRCTGGLCFQPQVKGLNCLRPETRKMVEDIVARIGQIEITSTCGGRHAHKSAHYSGKAIDFRPKATSPGKAAARLREIAAINGIGTYANGILHADVGGRVFSWHGKGSGRRHTRLARN